MRQVFRSGTISMTFKLSRMVRIMSRDNCERLERLELSRVPARLEDQQETDIPKLQSLRAALWDAARIVQASLSRNFTM